MSYATEPRKLSQVNVTSQELLGKVDTELNEHFPRLTRYVHGKKQKKGQSYKTFLVNLLETDALVSLSNSSHHFEDGVFLKVHMPIRHKLMSNRFNMTLEDMRNRLASMDIRYPLCVVGTGNTAGSRLNYIKALEDKIDGADFLTLVFVPSGLVNQYKGLWPNQIIVEIPFDRSAENVRDLTRQSIKYFGTTLGVNYVFTLEDDIYAVYRSTESGVTPVSLLEYLVELQETDSEGYPLVGSRSVALTENIATPSGAWLNESVSGIYLLKTDITANFKAVSQSTKIDAGLTQFNTDANEEGLVQQSQTLVLRRGYSTYDPVPEDGNQTLFQRVKYRAIENLEPEQGNLDLRVAVISNKVVQDITLADGTKWVRSLAIVGDETGSIILIGSTEEQIELLKEGNIVDIRGGKVQMLGGFMRVIVDRGLIVASPDQTALEANESHNLSTVEYELIE